MLTFLKFYRKRKILKELALLQNLAEESKKINKKLEREKKKAERPPVEKNEYADEGNYMIYDYGSFNYFFTYGRDIVALKRKKKLDKLRRRYILFCFSVYCLFLIFCYDVFEDYQFLYLYEFHKWW
jgi:hypothetical protein